MDREALKNKIIEKWPDAVALEGGEWLNIQVPAEAWREIALWLRDTGELHFDYLFCLTCVDWLKHMTMVYHLTSTRHRHNLVIKANLDRDTIRHPYRCRYLAYS
jgi:NADH-quinone oxidoreductase subunit C